MTTLLLLSRFPFGRFHPLVLSLVLMAGAPSLATAQVQSGTYSKIIIFGDSFSDVGNFAHVAGTTYGVDYPSSALNFNYSDGRFTNSGSTCPGSSTYVGLWHEQLASRFLGLTPATDSLDGGTDYAYGDATTQDGTSTVTEGPMHITVENMGQQVADYLTSTTNGKADAHALYIVWGGATTCWPTTRPPTFPRRPRASSSSSSNWRRPGHAGSSCPTFHRWVTRPSTMLTRRPRQP